VAVTDTERLASLDGIYAAQVAWCRARGISVTAPDRQVAFRVWPDTLRPPDGFGLAKVLPPNVIAGDGHGTLLIRERWKDNIDILAHECRHAITGQSGHPDWLFPKD
jgi:hypothetical protein